MEEGAAAGEVEGKSEKVIAGPSDAGAAKRLLGETEVPLEPTLLLAGIMPPVAVTTAILFPPLLSIEKVVGLVLAVLL
mgnify:CR=1 FL=1